MQNNRGVTKNKAALSTKKPRTVPGLTARVQQSRTAFDKVSVLRARSEEKHNRLFLFYPLRACRTEKCALVLRARSEEKRMFLSCARAVNLTGIFLDSARG